MGGFGTELGGSMLEVDVVVIGGGAMGSATAWQLARRGHSVTLLEQFEQGHHIGASHGATRNFNMAYAEHYYLNLVSEAKGLWDDVIFRSRLHEMSKVVCTAHHMSVWGTTSGRDSGALMRDNSWSGLIRGLGAFPIDG
jgi:glycine/D-amino acid oxidase-like deaminating enzyme